MNDCEHVEERLVDSFEGTLSVQERASVDAHLRACASCRETVEVYRAIRAAYRALPESDADEPTAARVLGAARDAAEPRSRWPLRIALLLAAAAALLLASRLPTWLSPSAPVDEELRVERLVSEAQELWKADALDLAATTFGEALARTEDDATAADVLQRLAELELERTEYARALEHLERLETDYPRFVDRRAALLVRSEALAGMGEYGPAIQALRWVAAEFPREERVARQRIRELEAASGLHPLQAAEDRQALRALGYVGE